MKRLEDFKDIHQDRAIVVCGCGRSLLEFKDAQNYITIGVNDVGRLFEPRYLVVLNRKDQFWGDRFTYIENSGADYIFTQIDLPINHPGIIKFKLGEYEGTDVEKPGSLNYVKNSPYVALCLAIHMGANIIGLIGVDFSDDHFFQKTGTHHLVSDLSQINRQYERLAGAAGKKGIRIYNLSSYSRLTAIEKIPLAQFSTLGKKELSGSISQPTPQKKSCLKIVSYSATPIAGVPAILSRCIQKETVHECRCVWQHRGYSNGVVFKGDIEWSEKPAEAEAVLSAADVVIIHNGKIDQRHRQLLADKLIITMAHNYMWNVNPEFVDQGFAGVVVGQYQATLPEFRSWSIVPNPLPMWEDDYTCEDKSPFITVCYTPSGKHDVYDPNHRLYWHSKGYSQTMNILDRLHKKYNISLEVVRNGQVPHHTALAMKCRSHIVIDECVTGSYHRSSLEGLAAGCVVVNAVQQFPEVVTTLQHCAETNQNPFVHATIESLEEKLTELIDCGKVWLEAQGKINRQWVENHWRFKRQWERFWWPVIYTAFQKNASKNGRLV